VLADTSKLYVEFLALRPQGRDEIFCIKQATDSFIAYTVRTYANNSTRFGYLSGTCHLASALCACMQVKSGHPECARLLVSAVLRFPATRFDLLQAVSHVMKDHTLPFLEALGSDLTRVLSRTMERWGR
jgi:hypothetical protein